MKTIDKDLSWLVDDLVEDIHTMVARHWADLSRRDKLHLVGGIARRMTADYLHTREVQLRARALLAERRATALWR